MERRDFLLTAVGVGVFTGASLSFGNFDEVFANTTDLVENIDMVAVKGGEPDVMLEKAMEALGGMGKFVKKGQKVVVKPNIGWDCTPDRAANTNPILVKRLVKFCLDAGAKEVVVFDNTCNEWQKCYKNSGIEKAVTEAGGKMLPGNSEEYYKPVDIPNGKVLKTTKVHEAILNCDVFINVPVLKHHESGKLTVSMKNLMGIIWDRKSWHRTDLHQCIADFATWRKPNLTIIDAYNVMTKNGPRGVSTADVVQMKQLLAGTDMVALDTAAAKVFGADPENINYITAAHDMKVGTKDLTKLNIKKIIL